MGLWKDDTNRDLHGGGFLRPANWESDRDRVDHSQHSRDHLDPPG